VNGRSNQLKSRPADAASPEIDTFPLLSASSSGDPARRAPIPSRVTVRTKDWAPGALSAGAGGPATSSTPRRSSSLARDTRRWEVLVRGQPDLGVEGAHQVKLVERCLVSEVVEGGVENDRDAEGDRRFRALPRHLLLTRREWGRGAVGADVSVSPASTEAEHYAELAQQYRAMGGVAYKVGLVQWAEAQQREHEVGVTSSPPPATSSSSCTATKPVVQMLACAR
jgi:hypothetical protein